MKIKELSGKFREDNSEERAEVKVAIEREFRVPGFEKAESFLESVEAWLV
ncbi:MAG: hypothetical protein IH914_10055 [candidate division Zixibacteria bacterium]|nr:hypothetical protein [candidate division Zixibacteria bacterium]